MRKWSLRDAAQQRRARDPATARTWETRFVIDSETNLKGHPVFIGGFCYRPHAELVLEAVRLVQAMARAKTDHARECIAIEARVALEKLEEQERIQRG